MTNKPLTAKTDAFKVKDIKNMSADSPGCCFEDMIQQEMQQKLDQGDYVSVSGVVRCSGCGHKNVWRIGQRLVSGGAMESGLSERKIGEIDDKIDDDSGRGVQPEDSRTAETADRVERIEIADQSFDSGNARTDMRLVCDRLVAFSIAGQAADAGIDNNAQTVDDIMAMIRLIKSCTHALDLRTDARTESANGAGDRVMNATGDAGAYADKRMKAIDRVTGENETDGRTRCVGVLGDAPDAGELGDASENARLAFTDDDFALTAEIIHRLEMGNVDGADAGSDYAVVLSEEEFYCDSDDAEDPGRDVCFKGQLESDDDDGAQQTQQHGQNPSTEMGPCNKTCGQGTAYEQTNYSTGGGSRPFRGGGRRGGFARRAMRGNGRSYTSTYGAFAFGPGKESSQPQMVEQCGKCGREAHDDPLECPANKRACNICKRVGHYAMACRMGGGRTRFANRRVRY